jgi:hypothetical protein
MLLDDGSNVESVYHRQAGNDEVHDEKLLNGIFDAIDLAKVSFMPFVQSVEDDAREGNDNISVNITLSERYNKANLVVLNDVLKDYVTSYVIALWWVAVSPELAKNYYDQASLQMDRMRQCFVKEAPKKPVYKYPTKIELKDGLEADFYQLLEGNELTIYYTVSGDVDDVKDDIVVESSNTNIYKVEKRDRWYVTKLSDSNEGYVVVYSKHNPDVCVRLG